MKKVFIVPTIRKRYRNQIEYCVDKRIFFLLKKIFKKFKIKSELNKSINLIIILGGNNLLSIKKNQENAIKERLSNKAFSYGLKNKIPILGICGGAQFLANKYGSNIVRTSKHVGIHNIIWRRKIFFQRKIMLPKRVNSYHNYKIKKLSNNFSIDAYTKDDSIELFSDKSKKLHGVMWHPERNKSINKFDIELIKKIK
mgnify:CR=1 FL=1|tara:strand:+ start:1585 stop:2178 length:594 start_codon:yes stop_codon:yes gene_type:complete